MQVDLREGEKREGMEARRRNERMIQWWTDKEQEMGAKWRGFFSSSEEGDWPDD